MTWSETFEVCVYTLISIALHRMFCGHQGLMIERVVQFCVAQLDQKFAFTWFDTEEGDGSRRCEHLVCVSDLSPYLATTPLCQRTYHVSLHPSYFADQCSPVAFLLYSGCWQHDLPIPVLLTCFIVAARRPSMLGCGKIPISRLMSKLPEQGARAQYVLPLANQVLNSSKRVVAKLREGALDWEEPSNCWFGRAASDRDSHRNDGA